MLSHYKCVHCRLINLWKGKQFLKENLKKLHCPTATNTFVMGYFKEYRFIGLSAAAMLNLARSRTLSTLQTLINFRSLWCVLLAPSKDLWPLLSCLVFEKKVEMICIPLYLKKWSLSSGQRILRVFPITLHVWPSLIAITLSFLNSARAAGWHNSGPLLYSVETLICISPDFLLPLSLLARRESSYYYFLDFW